MNFLTILMTMTICAARVPKEAALTSAALAAPTSLTTVLRLAKAEVWSPQN